MAFGTKRCFTQLDSPDVLSGNFNLPFSQGIYGLAIMKRYAFAYRSKWQGTNSSVISMPELLSATQLFSDFKKTSNLKTIKLWILKIC